MITFCVVKSVGVVNLNIHYHITGNWHDRNIREFHVMLGIHKSFLAKVFI